MDKPNYKEAATIWLPPTLIILGVFANMGITTSAAVTSFVVSLAFFFGAYAAAIILVAIRGKS